MILMSLQLLESDVRESKVDENFRRKRKGRDCRRQTGSPKCHCLQKKMPYLYLVLLTPVVVLKPMVAVQFEENILSSKTKK